MTNRNNGEDSNNEGKQNRSVNISKADNVQIVSGDNAKVNTVFEGKQVVITTQDFVKALTELKKVLGPAGIEPIKRQEMEKAIIDAETEAVKDKPDKGRIAQALEKMVTVAKGATNAKELVLLAAPHIQKAAAWLGDAGSGLLAMLK